MIRWLVLSSFAFSFSAGAVSGPDGKMNSFINQLIGKMTIEEKVGQMAQYTAEMAVTGNSIKDNYREDITHGRVGSILNAYGPKFTRDLQKLAVENTRLKIPLLFGYDVIHGHKTIFPIPLGESASWDLPRMEKSARIAGREASADGLHWTFAPMVDISREPRWGRIAEGAGEDPWLGSKVAEARVHGFQGKGLGSTDSIMACVKHFAAYGAPIAGREYNSVDMSERELLETYLPPYEAAVKAGASSVMPSFNDIAGVPSTANEWLISKILRGRWKFRGFVVTDYTAINELVPHGVAANEKAAALLAFKAGVDIDMQGGVFNKYLPELVREGKIKRGEIDQAVRRILEAKYRLGLFDDPYRFSDEKRAETVIMTKENLEHAREISRRSIVLLKNQGGLLPLKKTGTVALIGPYVDDQRNLIGNWSGAGDWKKAVTLLDGIKDVGGKDLKILTARGSNLLAEGHMLSFLNEHGGSIQSDPRTADEMIKEAVKTAKKADVVVLALGETQGMSGEAAARTRIRLPENQQALLKAIQETGKPIVLVLYNGRPLVLETENAMANAIVESWFLGTEAGHAIADVLFGDYNPSGRLTVTFPLSEGQIPIFYATRVTGRPFDDKIKYTSKYIDSPNEPLFPFGFGLSYTEFSYSEVTLSREKLKLGEKLTASVTVTNSGSRDGEETVQMYIHDLVASVSRPVKQLRGFAKVFLKKGESRVVSLELGPEDLKFYDQNMKWVAEPGVFKVMMGGNSRDLKETSFTLVK